MCKAAKKAVRFLYCFFGFIIFLTSMQFSSFASTKKEEKRDIAIVFDNSGSMYPGKMTWCQATYAMEVFASMMNEGDNLKIYPMNPIQIGVGGQTYSYDRPLEITDPSKASTIREIYSPKRDDGKSLDTHIESIMRAYEGLNINNGNEKWLIVLTDGAEFYENGEGLGEQKTVERLTELLSEYSDKVQVLYLGIDIKESSKPEISGKYRHDPVIAKSADVPVKLSEMCNTIFGRDELPVSDSSKVSFDIPLSKLIVFAQSNDIAGISISGANGKISDASSLKLKYSELGAENYLNNQKIDESLQGIIVTYQDVPAGSYDVKYNGNAGNVVFYYEPDVDLAIQLIDSESGQPVTSGIHPGSYTLTYSFVDKDGNPTTSKLLGNTSYVINYSISGSEETLETNTGGTKEIEFKDGDSFDVNGKVTFLKNYTIEKTAADCGFPEGGLMVSARSAGDLVLELSGGKDTYKRSTLEDEAHYEVKLKHNGSYVSGDDIKALIRLRIQGGELNYDAASDGDKLNVNLKHAGEMQDTVCGDYTLTAQCAFTNEDGATAQSNSLSIPFAIEDEDGALLLDVKTDIKYIVKSKINELEPFKATVTLNGEKLTDEQLTNTTLIHDQKDIDFDITPILGQSAFSMKMKGNGSIKSGNRKITFTATTLDDVGRTVSADDSKKVEIQAYPQWMRWAAIALIILLIAGLIWFILSRKILPAKIYSEPGESKFTSNGQKVTSHGKPISRKLNLFERLLSKETSFTVQSPQDGSGATMNIIRVKVKPHSTVKDVLFNRKRAKATAYLQDIPQQQKKVTIGGAIFKYNNAKKIFADISGNPTSEVPIELMDGTSIQMNEPIPQFGGTKNLSYSTIIHIKW